ncbi:DNA adenine methylase [Parasphingorhabdus sp.]|uniref:DNA adenine methylase n=1 Tax=Parasphingorhabdus sp. TaxID=2709688 RepID=UPI003D2C1FDE
MGEIIKPFLKWAGGKRWLTGHERINFPPQFQTYFEPFLGGGAIFLHLRPRSAVLSDVNERLVETYDEIQNNPSGILDLLTLHQEAHCKDYYYRIRVTEFDTSTQRAAQFLYLNRTCWNGLYRVNKKGKFNVPIGTKDRVLDPTEDFFEISKILKRAKLICGDFEKTIDMAGMGDFVFCDPPYTTRHNNNGFVKYNENIFSWDDQKRLAYAAFRAKKRGATVIVTNADHSSVRDLYQNAEELKSMGRMTVISGKNKGRSATTELLVEL